MKKIYKALLSIIIIICGYSNGFSQSTLTIGTVNGTPGNSVSVTIQATGISDMTGFQFTVAYDKTKLTYINCTNWVAGLNATQVLINSLDGKITFVYTDAAINIVNGKFFDLNFNALNGSSGSASISWSDSPTQRELSNSIPNEISCVYTNGAVMISTATPAPLAPVAVAASIITQTSFTANWNASATATGYRLDVALDNAFTNYVTGYQNKDVGSVTTLPVTVLIANTTYYYRVKATNSGGTSGVSSTINTTTLQIPAPAPPVAVAATSITLTGFTANWNASATATGYQLDVALDNAFTNFVTGYQNKEVGNVTTLPVSLLTANTTYYYRVKATNSGATSSVSNTINAKTLSNVIGATLIIGNMTGTSGSSVSVPIQATGLSDMTGFQFTITYDKTKLTYVNCNNWVAGLNATQVLINSLDGKITFVYTDVAITIANGKFFDLNFTVANSSSGNAVISWSDSPTQRELSNSIPDEISCVYTNGAVSISATTPPLAPVATVATSITQTGLTANWNASATATGYQLDVALDNAFTNYVAGYQNKEVGNVTTLTVSLLTVNTTYYYRVKATNSGGTSSVSNTINTTTLQIPAPVSPVAIAATSITQTGFTANWNASATATGYRLDIALDNAFTNYLVGYQNKDVGYVTTLPVSLLTANTTYYYRVKATNSGGTSSVSNTINAKTLPNVSSATLAIGNMTATSGNSVSVPIQATGLSDMTGFQFTITYDKTKLTYVNCTNWIAGLNATQVLINSLDGKITFVYTDVAITIANGKFFDLNFTAINGSSGIASISWSDSPTQRELSNSIPDEISCSYTNGAVSIFAATPAPVAVAATSITQIGFTANWNASATATGYQLDVALDNAFTNFLTGYQNKEVGNVTTLPVSLLTANTTYYYRVKATNSGGTSSVSNTINITTLQIPAPYVVDGGYRPTDGETSVKTPLTLRMTFNENVFAGTSTAEVKVYEQTVSSNKLVFSTSITSAMISGKILTIPVTYKLLDNAVYSVLVDNGIVKNASNIVYGPGVTDPTSWNFSTGDNTPPELIITAPAPPISTSFILSFTFNENVTGVASAISAIGGIVKQITGSGKNYYATIDAAEKAVVQVTISDAIIDAAGNKFAGKTTTFTVGDFTGPTVVVIDPKSPVATIFTVGLKFNEPVTGVIEGVTVTGGKLDNISSISGTGGTEYTLTVSAKEQTAVTIVLPATIKDMSLNANAFATQTLNYTTGDFTAPTLMNWTPANGSTTVDNHPLFTMSFSENVMLGIGGNLKVYKVNSSTLALTIPIKSSMINGKDVSISYTATQNGLDKNANYYVLVDGTALKDNAGNTFVGISDAVVWTFKTGANFVTELATVGSIQSKIYPNPVTNELVIEVKGNTTQTKFEIINSLGQTIFYGTILEKAVVQTTSFAPGVYLIKLESGKAFEFKKIIKK